MFQLYVNTFIMVLCLQSCCIEQISSPAWAGCWRRKHGSILKISGQKRRFLQQTITFHKNITVGITKYYINNFLLDLGGDHKVDSLGIYQ